MSWLEAAFGLDDAEPAAKPAEPPRRAPEIQSCVAVVRQPSGDGDYGSVVDCWFYVDAGWVVLCSQSGKSIDIEQKLGPGDVPASVAKRLKRQAWHRENDSVVSGFSGPLRYGRAQLG